MDVLKKQSRIRAVHAACRALGIDDATRHELQVQITGHASLKDMSAFDLDSVLNHLNRNGQARPNAWGFVFRLPADRRELAKKIYRLAEKVGALQSPPVGAMSKRYVEGIAERMLGADTVLEFCDAPTLRKVVQALEIHARRLETAANPG
jgi:phage gp16-like protein